MPDKTTDKLQSQINAIRKEISNHDNDLEKTKLIIYNLRKDIASLNTNIQILKKTKNSVNNKLISNMNAKLKELKSNLENSYKCKTRLLHLIKSNNNIINKKLNEIASVNVPIRNNYIYGIDKNASSNTNNINYNINKQKKFIISENKYWITKYTNRIHSIPRTIKQKRGKNKDNKLPISKENNNIINNHTNFYEAISNLCGQIHNMLNIINNEHFPYNSKVQFTDIFYTIIMRLVNDMSYMDITTELDENYILKVSEATLCKKRNNIDYIYFKQMFEIILSYVKIELKKYNNRAYIGIELFATDGSTLNFFRNIKGSNFKEDKNGRYTKATINTIYNITYDLPENIIITNENSESKILISQIDNVVNLKILTADSHYFTEDVLGKLKEKDIKYVIKVSKSICKEFHDSDKNSSTMIYRDHHVRLVKEINGHKKRIIGTNLSEESYNNKKIIEIYGQRWRNEEFYRDFKCKLNMETSRANSYNSIMQEAYTALIIITLAKYIGMLGTLYIPLKKNNIRTVINKKTLIKKFVKIMFLILYEDINEKEIINNLEHIVNVLINKIIKIIDNRHNMRIRQRPQPGYKNNGTINVVDKG